jgi:hypothetical protein
MRLTAETLTLFLLLVPGFVSSAVLNAVVVRQAKGRVGHVIEALVFSFLIYACLAPFFGGSPVSVEVTTVGDQTTYRPTADPALLISAMGLAILFALVVGASITHDFHMKILRCMRLTYRTARDSTWIDIFIDQRRYVEVAFTDGRRLFGWPLYYSNQPEEGLLYLYDAAWIDADGKYVDLDAHGILLTKKDDIESIVFTNLEFGQAGPRGEDRQGGDDGTR